MSFWGWAWTVAAAWGVLSALNGIGWLLAGRRIFRKPPAPPRLVIKTELTPEEAAADVIAQFKRQMRRNGGL